MFVYIYINLAFNVLYPKQFDMINIIASNGRVVDSQINYYIAKRLIN